LSEIIKIHKPPGRIRASYKMPVDVQSEGGKYNDFIPLVPDDGVYTGNGESNRHNGNPGGDGRKFGDDFASSVTSNDEIGRENEYRRGYEEGREEAIRELQNSYDDEMKEIRRLMTEFVRSIYDQLEDFKRKNKQFALRMSVAIAAKIVKHEVLLHDDVVLAQIKDALHKILGVEKIKVLVNPQDEELVRVEKNSLLTSADSVREIVIEPDEKIERGGCVIESMLGNVDARISTQLKNIHDALDEKAMRGRKPLPRKQREIDKST
jgi:flagellar biosynthesis/type III secretory pathway protein FliH